MYSLWYKHLLNVNSDEGASRAVGWLSRSHGSEADLR